MGNQVSSDSDSMDMDIDIDNNKVNIINQDIRNCMSKYFDFKDPDIMTNEISKYIINGDHTEKTRTELYKKIFTNLNDIDRTKIEKKISSGAFGIIYQYQGRKVLKVPKGDLSDKSDALIEIISNIVYQCYKEKILDIVPIPSNFRWPFPTIYKCSKVNINNDKDPMTSPNLISILMDRVERDCWSLQTRDFNIYTSLMIQTAVALYGLQQSVGFIHRDLHLGNIMIDTSPVKTTSIYKLGGKEISTRSNILIYIIDLGQSCANLSNCIERKCDNIILEGPASSHNVSAIDGCFNRSFDLRLFTGCLAIDYISKHLKISGYSSQQMIKFFYENNKNFTKLDILMVKIYIHAFQDIQIDPNQTLWHQLYQTLSFRPSRTIFTPERFFDFIYNDNFLK